MGEQGAESLVNRAGLKLCVDELGLELQILLPLPLKCEDYRHALPCPLYAVLGIKSRGSHMLGMHSTH